MMTTIKKTNRIIIVYLLDKSVKAINKVPIQKDNSPLTLWKYTYPTYTSTHPNRSTSKNQFSQKIYNKNWQ